MKRPFRVDRGSCPSSFSGGTTHSVSMNGSDADLGGVKVFLRRLCGLDNELGDRALLRTAAHDPSLNFCLNEA